MGKIIGTPNLELRVRDLPLDKKGYIGIEDIILSSSGELFMNLNATLYFNRDIEEKKGMLEEDKKENTAYSRLDSFIPIERISNEESWFLIDIDNQSLFTLTEESAIDTVNNRANGTHYVLIGTIENTSQLIKEVLLEELGEDATTTWEIKEVENISLLKLHENELMEMLENATLSLEQLDYEELEGLLALAIKEERYEFAAQLRDAIDVKKLSLKNQI